MTPATRALVAKLYCDALAACWHAWLLQSRFIHAHHTFLAHHLRQLQGGQHCHPCIPTQRLGMWPCFIKRIWMQAALCCCLVCNI